MTFKIISGQVVYYIFHCKMKFNFLIFKMLLFQYTTTRKKTHCALSVLHMIACQNRSSLLLVRCGAIVDLIYASLGS